MRWCTRSGDQAHPDSRSHPSLDASNQQAGTKKRHKFLAQPDETGVISPFACSWHLVLREIRKPRGSQARSTQARYSVKVGPRLSSLVFSCFHTVCVLVEPLRHPSPNNVVDFAKDVNLAFVRCSLVSTGRTYGPAPACHYVSSHGNERTPRPLKGSDTILRFGLRRP